MLFYRPTKKSNHTFSLIRLRLPAIISLIPLKNKNVKLIPILPLLMLVLLSGCAAEWQKQRTADGQLHFSLNTSRSSTQPVIGLVPIQITDLQAGDILFSAEPGIQSFSIRLANNTSVSHAFIYLGDGLIAEAIGSGVQIISLEQAMRQTTLLTAFRRPGLQAQEVEKIREFAYQEQGGRYNYFGILKQSTYSITRHVCELPVVPRRTRHLCRNSLALIQITPFGSERFFCSQFVVEAFNRAGKPLTDTPPEWVSPADILHMREGDVASVTPVNRLQYIGHLQCRNSPWNRCTTLAAHP